MASETDIEIWDIDLDHASDGAAWHLSGYNWDSFGLRATKNAVEVAGPQKIFTQHANTSDGAGGKPTVGMDPERLGCGLGMDPGALAAAPVYQPQPSGCKLMVCQVAGCGVSLDGMKGYFLRHRVCEEHSKAPLLLIGNVPSRLCQQCSKFHHVSEFEGIKRTCRMQLDRIRVNKRIRRSRKLNAAGEAVQAVTGSCRVDDSGEQPAPPATAAGGSRAKRPADSSCGSGDASWADSRKTRHVAGGGAARNIGGGAGGSGAGTATGPALVGVDAELLPESGGSDTGSREHPRTSLGGSDALRWQQPSPQCPAAPWLPAAGHVQVADADRAHALADSPLSAAHGSSLLAVASQRADSSAGGGGNSIHEQQLRFGGTDFGRCGSSAPVSGLPPAGSEYGPPGSIVAAAAAAGLFEQQQPMAAVQPPGPMLLPPTAVAMLPQPQHNAVATAAPGRGSGTGALLDYHTLGAAPAAGMACGPVSGLGAPHLLQEAGSGPRAPEVASPWTTSGLEDSVRQQLQPQQPQQQQTRGLAESAVAPASASGLHPLLQQQLRLQQQQVQQQAQQGPVAWPAEQYGTQTAQASCALPLAGAGPSGAPVNAAPLYAAGAGAVAPLPPAAAACCTSQGTTGAAVLPGAQAAAPGPHSGSKLVRMSLENDNALGDSDALMCSLLDMLQAQGADPRDGEPGQRPPSLGARNAAPSASSGQGSLGSGTGLCDMVHAGVSTGAASMPCGGHGFVVATSDASALSRAGSAATGSPQGAGCLSVAAGMALQQQDSADGRFASAMLAPPYTGQHGNGAGAAAMGLVAPFGQASAPLPVARCSNMDGMMSGPGPLQQQVPVVQPGLAFPAMPSGDVLLQQQVLQRQQELLILQQQRLQQLQAQMQVPAPQTAPAAGMLLSRLLDADSKAHHLSSDLNGCLAEKQLLRRQLLATLSCQAPEPGDITSAVMATARPLSAFATGLPGMQQGTAPNAPMPLGMSLRPHSQTELAAAQLRGAGLGFGGLGACGPEAASLGLGLGLGGAGLGSAGLGGAGMGVSAGWLGSSAGGLAGSGTAGVPGAPYGFGGPSGAGIVGGVVPLGHAASGLLGPSRPSAAAQLQALVDARAAAAAGGACRNTAGIGGFPMPSAAAAMFGGGGGGMGAASGVGGGGGGGAAVPPELLTRMSLKIMNCLPDELPHDIRSRMHLFASQAPMDVVQGCLRPGCTELVLDTLHAAAEEPRLAAALLRSGDAAAAAAALLSALPACLAAKELVLQLGDTALWLRPGATPRIASWGAVGLRRGGVRAAKPELVAVESPVLHVHAEGAERTVRARVYGRHLTDPGVTLLARMAGMALPLSIRPAAAVSGVSAASPDTASFESSHQPAPSAAPGAPATSTTSVSAPSPAWPDTTAGTSQRAGSGGNSTSSHQAPASTAPASAVSPKGSSGASPLYDAYDVEVELPYNAPLQGLLVLEPRAGLLLGGWRPVLLLAEPGAAAEAEALVRGMEAGAAARLVSQLGLFVDHAERCAAVVEAEEEEEEAVAESMGEEGLEGAQSGADEAGRDADAAEGATEQDDASSTGCAAARSQPAFAELFGSAHGRVVGMGRSLLAYCALRGCPQLVALLGSALVEMGEPLAALPAAACASLDLLGCALLSGDAPVLRIAAEWAARGGAEVDWRAQVAGQPQGANLLHLAAALPLPAATEALDALCSLALATKQQPAFGDAFAAAWFADGGDDGLGAPCVLFRARIATAAAMPASYDAAAGDLALTTTTAAAAADALAAAAAVAERLDRLCLLRLAAAYVRTHSFTSPLNHVELPSLDSNSVARTASSSGGDNGTAHGSAAQSPRAWTESLRREVAQEALSRSAADCAAAGEGGMFAGLDSLEDVGEVEAQEAAQLQVQDLGVPSGSGKAGLRADSRSAVSSLAREALLPAGCSEGADRSGHSSAAVGTPPAPHHLLQQASFVTASPPRMRVEMAPKALAQTAAAAAATGTWRDSGSGSGADASLVPPSATTAATTAYGSGSLTAFPSCMTAGMLPSACGSSLASAADARPYAVKPLPMAPLLNMDRPLPESPCASREQDGGCGDSGQAVLEPSAGVEPTQPAAIAEARVVEVPAVVVAAADELAAERRAVDSACGADSASAGVCAAGGVETEAAGVPSEARRGHMSGLARMFKRLFKAGGASSAGKTN